MDWNEKILVSRTLAMPGDTNPFGDIFGGWIMSVMDISVGTIARRFARSKVVTRAVNNISFEAPILVGDEVSVYVHLKDVGNTSMTFDVEVSLRRGDSEVDKVAVTGTFVMVALDENRKPKQIRQEIFVDEKIKKQAFI